MSNKIKIKVATYNVGDYTGKNITHGSEESREAFRAVMKKVDADLWALQEDVEFFNKETKETAFDAVYSTVLPNYKRNFTGNYNGKAFLTKFELSDVEPVRYTGDMKFRHPWYLKGKLAVEDKEITLVCLHFDWSDQAVRAEEIRQLIEFVKTQEYCIIMGDFNPEDYVDDGKKVSNKLFYKEELARFQEVGFDVANAGRFGTFDTIVHDSFNAISPCPFDNILVSPKLKLVAADRVAEPWMNDHALVWAEIEIQ
ncbi:MAG: endonuclease/exonuclease/phosphatase family protein [Clostridia bacterium]|nr:endonuclease/exonuclease/phosphatase family protein [Clostridia bacterium]